MLGYVVFPQMTDQASLPFYKLFCFGLSFKILIRKIKVRGCNKTKRRKVQKVNFTDAQLHVEGVAKQTKKKKTIEVKFFGVYVLIDENLSWKSYLNVKKTFQQSPVSVESKWVHETS